MSRDSASSIESREADGYFDVAVLGGGLAGQCLARQLRNELPQLSIVVIDMLNRPLPEAAFKVGEATVEMGAHYLSEGVGLTDYLNDRQLLKMGLRYFMGDSTGPFEDRPEIGISERPRFDTYLLDRGRLENDLRAMNEADGVRLVEGAKVDEVELAGDDEPHVVTYRPSGGGAESLSARWVVDATGRRRLLQRKLDLGEPEDSHCSAAWFRVDGKVDVENLVDRDRDDWHDRVPEDMRHRAVVHLLGEGYWVWIIALPTDSTSIGIVTDELIHSASTYATKKKAMSWLAAHEPDIAEHLESFPRMDFKVMKGYSYTSKQVFSTDRWTCVGEAGVFADPFYSPGIDMIGVGNTISIEMIRRDFEGRLSSNDVDEWNQWFIALNHALTHNIQLGFPLFGRPTPTAAKIMWDFAAAWGYQAPHVFNQTYLNRHAFRQYRAVTSHFAFLQSRMQKLFKDWAHMPPGRTSYSYLDYFSLRYVLDLRDRNLQAGKSTDELIDDATANMAILEELAQVLFLAAVADQFPDQLPRFRDPVWLNVWALGMDPSRWDGDGLFAPRTEPRDLGPIRDDLFRGLGLESELRELSQELEVAGNQIPGSAG